MGRLQQIPKSEFALSHNEDVTRRRFLQLLYARYVCFRVFLQSAAATDGGIKEDHKGRWLLIQLAPVTLLTQSDIFLNLFRLVGKALSEDLDAAILDESITIKALLPQQPTLFCVLDEAQTLTKDSHFRSSNDPVQGRPILRPIISTWKEKLPNLIVSGTGIPMQAVEPIMGARVAKEGGGPEMMTEIGGFDDADGQRAYLERYFLPGFLDKPEGKAIASRVGYWLRGRFVFNAAV